MTIREKTHGALPGGLMLLIGLGALGFALYLLYAAAQLHDGSMGLGALGVALLGILLLAGLFVVNPNEARVLQLFGRYVGTAKLQGLRWASPFYSKRTISVRVRNFETE